MSVLTIRIDRDLEREIEKAALRRGRSKSAFVRDALRRQLALERLDALRQRIMPFAESRGYLTDEDVFRDVS
jgi:predicted transcriptional regulator